MSKLESLPPLEIEWSQSRVKGSAVVRIEALEARLQLACELLDEPDSYTHEAQVECWNRQKAFLDQMKAEKLYNPEAVG